MLVRNGDKTIGATDPELLRPHVGAQLSVATMLDGSATVAVGNWGLSRHAGLGLIELATPIDTGLDVRPLDLGAVCASVDTRGMPSVLVGILRNPSGPGFVRSWVPAATPRAIVGIVRSSSEEGRSAILFSRETYHHAHLHHP